MPHLAPVVFALLALMADPPTPTDVVSALETALADAIAKAEPSVVAIARDKDGKGTATTAVRGQFPVRLDADPPIPPQFGGFRNFDNPIPDYVASDYASGVVIGDRNQILTTAHAIKGASRLLVRAAGGQVFEAEVIAADPRSDLAVIAPREIRDLPQRRVSLRPITIGPPKTLRKGSFLLALGNPFNSGIDGQASASWGILSNTARRLNASPSEPFENQLRHYPTLYQLDAKLNLGMSGGAVVNLRGELVGLTTNAVNAGGFDAQAGYAIPIDPIARRAIESLRDGKEVEYGFLGIGLAEDRSNKIATVTPGTPAGEGGLLANDVVLSIGGLPVIDADSLVITVNSFPPSTPIKLRVLRQGKELEKTVILSKLPVAGEVIATNRPAAWRGLRVDFVSTVSNVGQFGNGVLEAMAKGGVRVADVLPGTGAEGAGLKPGQIIVAVEGEAVRNPSDFARAVAPRSGPVTLTLEENQTVTISAK